MVMIVRSGCELAIIGTRRRITSTTSLNMVQNRGDNGRIDFALKCRQVFATLSRFT